MSSIKDILNTLSRLMLSLARRSCNKDKFSFDSIWWQDDNNKAYFWQVPGPILWH